MLTTRTLFDQLLKESTGSAEEKKLVPAFATEEMKEVLFSTEPLPKTTSIKTLSRRDFEKKVAKERKIFDYQWTNSSYVPAVIKQKYAAITQSAGGGKEVEDLKPVLNNTTPYKLVICKMQTTGFATFTGSVIPSGVDFTHYSGQIRPLPDYNEELDDKNWQIPLITESSYLFNLMQVEKDGLRKRMSKKNQCSISAKYSGNFASFMQHLPTRQELITLGLEEPAQLSYIAQENVSGIGEGIYDYPALGFITQREIAPGEQLGFSYGFEYWSNKGSSITLFNRRGEDLLAVKLDQKIKSQDLIQKIMIIELGYLTDQEWRFNLKRNSIYLELKEEAMSEKVQVNLKEKNIMFKISRTKDLSSYFILVDAKEYPKLVKLAQTEDLVRKLKK